MVNRVEGGGGIRSTRYTGGGSFGGPTKRVSTLAKNVLPGRIGGGGFTNSPMRLPGGPQATQPQIRQASRANNARANVSRSAPTAPRIASNPTGQISRTMVQPAAIAPPPEPAVPVMSENEFLGSDSTYLSQQSALRDALANYEAQMGQQKQKYQTDYSAKKEQLGYDPANPRGLYKQAISDTQDDFAGRGLLQSGLFGQAFDRMGQGFAQQAGDLDRGWNDFQTDLTTDFSNFKQEQNLTAERAKADALARFAAQFGLG